MKTFQLSYISFRSTALAVLTISLVFVSTGVGAQNYLYNVTDLAAGNGPAGVIFEDFNHDGVLDLAVSNFDDNTVSIMLGSSNGQFAARVNYATGASPMALAAADLRNDGNVDLVVVNSNDGSGSSGSVSVLLGNGDGTFQAEASYAVGNYPVGIVAADFNDDGKLDLAVVNENDNTVSILLGNGDGTFQSQTVVDVGTEPTSLGSGDFNGDHKTDLIASCVGSGVVSVLLSNGNGTFTRVDSPSGIQAPDTSLLVVGDFNKDKKLDVVVSSRTYQQLFILLGEGNGSFEAPAAIPSAPFNPVEALVAADFNHDGKLDVASVGLDSLSGVVVSLGKGDGTFQPPTVSPSGPASGLAVADVNGDGRLDLAATNQSVNSVGLLLGKGDGTFAMPKAVTLTQTPYFPDAAVAADFNGDGKLDLAVAEVNFPNGQISVVLGKGNGKFGNPVNSPLASEGINNQDFMLAGDFNGDGKPDLAVMDDYATGFQVLLGNGNGTFQAPVDTKLNTSLTFAAGDFNRDGKTDLVVSTVVNGQVLISIYLSNGDGTFTVGAQYTEEYSGVNVADVNGDGKLDLVLISFGNPLLVMLGNGDGTFQKPIPGPSAFYSGGAVIRDFNGDGNPDIAVGTYNGIAFLEGNGKGAFQEPVYSNSTIQFCCELVAGDVNGDGKLDLVNNTNEYMAFVVMLGNGDGTFQAPVAYGANGQLSSGNLVVGDFNSDGVEDIALAIQDSYSGATIASVSLSIPAVNLFPTSVNFGPVEVGQTSPATSIQLTNRGNARLAISRVAVSGDFLQQDNCGDALSIGSTCTFQVSFKPTAKGVRKGTLTIKDNALASPQRISLEGTGQ